MGDVLGCLEENLWIQFSENSTGITLPRVYKGLERKPHFCGISERAGKTRNSESIEVITRCAKLLSISFWLQPKQGLPLGFRHIWKYQSDNVNRQDFQKLKLCKSQRNLLGKGKRESSLGQMEGDENSVSGKLVLL